MIAALFATSLTGACWIRDEWARPTPGAGGASTPLSAGTNVRSEVIGFWLPESLRELANPEARARIATDPEALRHFLESRREQDPVCTVVIRGYQAGGGHSDIAFLRRPCEEPGHFRELWDALSAAIAEGQGAERDSFQAPARIVADEAPGREGAAPTSLSQSP